MELRGTAEGETQGSAGHVHRWPPTQVGSAAQSLLGQAHQHAARWSRQAGPPHIWVGICHALGPTQGTAGRLLRTHCRRTACQAAPGGGLTFLHTGCSSEPPGEPSRSPRPRLQRFGFNWGLVLTSGRTENHWIRSYIFLVGHFWMRGQRPSEATRRRQRLLWVMMVFGGQGLIPFIISMCAPRPATQRHPPP